MSSVEDLRTYLASGRSLIIAQEQDERRFLHLVRDIAGPSQVPVWTWSLTRGLVRDGIAGEAAAGQYQTRDLKMALEFIGSLTAPGLFVFMDAHPSLTDPLVVRRIKELAQAARPGQTVIVTTPQPVSVPELAGLACVWTLAPPTGVELEALVIRTIEDLAARNIAVELNPDARRSLVAAVRGLSASEAERLVQQAALKDGRLSDDDVAYVGQAKAELLEGTGPIELVEASRTLDHVGGMLRLKQWLMLRGVGLGPAGEGLGLDPPRGILLTGVPGCGKSLMAKSLAGTWGYPLVLLDPARLFGPYVGESEQRMQRALAAVEAMSPVVLWIDEIEKGFAQGHMEDGGVSARMLGTFLRWMQDHPPGVFVIATANDVQALPPEFLRKGRFDEIFFVDLPDTQERQAIFALHLSRRKHDPKGYDLDSLSAAAEGFSGSEIEAAVVAALYRAYSDHRELDTAEILAELKATQPLSRTRAEDISALRAWASGRTVPA
jgi:ATPase family protein associated with various cellular activities (AAA)